MRLGRARLRPGCHRKSRWPPYAVQLTNPLQAVASTTTPNTMRYQAKPLKLWLEMNLSSQRTHSQALMKENSRPTPNSGRSAADSSARSLYRL